MTQSINALSLDAWLSAQAWSRVPVCLLYGEEAALLYRTQQQFRQYAKQHGAEHTILYVDQQLSSQALQGLIQQESLFTTQRYIDMRVHSKLNKALYQTLLNTLQDQNIPVMLTITLDQVGWADKKDKRFQQLMRTCTVLVCDTPNPQALRRWITHQAPFSPQTPAAWIDTFMARCHHACNTIMQELPKLALLFPEGVPSEEALHTHILADHYDVALEALTPSFLGCAAQPGPVIIEQLRQQGTPAPLVLWRIAEDIRQWLRCYSYLQKPMSHASAYREAKIFGQRQEWYTQSLQSTRLTRMETALRYCLDIDRMLKGIPDEAGFRDPWQGFIQLYHLITHTTG